jgi:hypothetical protein
MKKDIPNLKVEDLAIAIVPLEDPQPEDELWEVYILNLKEEPIRNVLIASRGYGEMDGETVKTSTLRHFFEAIGGLQILKIEPIQTRLFGIANEYWVSFTFDGNMYDKKYVFVAGSIDAAHFTRIPFLNRKGVMIR